MDELIAFLEARLAEDEAAANAWLPLGNPTEAQRDHIARHDPARVLADVAAKRKIVDVAAESVALKDLSYYEDHSGERELAAFVLRQLAQPYADHPAFDPAWRM